ncbi:hypothetical protein H7U37_02365 [Pseudoflavonifractor phocaeensis]|uniref:hypothetical protein n=1 Tax=Pseudoflavonifractor phocaeensis TaxID=1870988 RepID=UPI00195EAFAE|nr:hypothetical protein [Pseudoflavonifractor phocaeensis]MBM6937372.1 hypothetical protein [Pseudoflavonifractor phocaeensis]
MKKIAALFLFCVLALSLSACNSSSNNGVPPSETGSAGSTANFDEVGLESEDEAEDLVGDWTLELRFPDDAHDPLILRCHVETEDSMVLYLDDGTELTLSYGAETTSPLAGEGECLWIANEDGSLYYTGAYSYDRASRYFGFFTEEYTDDGHILLPGSTFWDVFPRKGGKEVRLLSAESFSEGAAWITVVQGDDDYPYFYTDDSWLYLIDHSGQVLHSIHDHTNTLTTNFKHGACLVHTEEDEYLLSNTGEVIWSVSEDGWAKAERLFGAGSVEAISIDNDHHENNFRGIVASAGYSHQSLPFNGYCLVNFEVNTFEKTGDFMGILDSSGQWVLEPMDSNIKLYCDKCYAEYYLDGICYVINLETREVAQSPDHYELWDVMDAWQDAYDREFQNGLLYDKEKDGFIDADGNVVIDLSGYSITYSFAVDPSYVPTFCNGYCVLPVNNADGAQYVTVLDTQGNQVVPPIKNPDGCGGYASDGYFLSTRGLLPQFYQSHFPASEAYIRLADGQPLDIPYLPEYAFSEGVAVVRDDHNRHYYIDVNGNDVFPQPQS